MNTTKTIVHLSDLHFREHWEEEQGIVLAAFFNDLAKQIRTINPSDVMIAFSGDIVLAGGKADLYDRFIDRFDAELTKLKIPKEQRICVPGNHDVSAPDVLAQFVEHEGVVTQGLDEQRFNDYASRTDCLLRGKFTNYMTFESAFARFGVANHLGGTGWGINDDIGVYCLNSAVCSSGGAHDVKDEGRLAVDTRALHKWLLESRHKTRILLMHHPLSWLTPWAQVELKQILHSHFALCLSGHAHTQAVYHSIHQGEPLVECSAPPLMTRKQDRLGYSIVTVASNGVVGIQYRQWTARRSFVTGVEFSDTDDGRVPIQQTGSAAATDNLGDRLEERLNNALRSYSSQPIVWVEPVLSNINRYSRDPEEEHERAVDLSKLVAEPRSTLIKAPPQFGLTCLAHYLAKEAWTHHRSRWLYLDASEMRPLAAEKAAKKVLAAEGLDKRNVACVIVDQWTTHEAHALKNLEQLSKMFQDTPMIVMQTIDDMDFSRDQPEIAVGRPLDVLHLLALPRAGLRRVVSAYNEMRRIGDDDVVLTKVVGDMDLLNIHRTPLNCITLLKVSEKYFDESPVNRTKMLEMVLFLLFNTDGIPTYKAKPDLKDCEYVLGRYCERMLRTEKYTFSRDDFIKDLRAFCLEKLIDLEVDVVFDVLFDNNIITRRHGQYAFRFSYWVFYFAAQRMRADAVFTKWIFSEKRYVSFPEIVEFYTGIDRSRDDALAVLLEDLRNASATVEQKVGLPKEMNPLGLAKWETAQDSKLRMQDQVSEDVLKSNLPAEVKDRYADRSYDPSRPYDQSIGVILEKYSLAVLMRSVKASARALRNSDYVAPRIKQEMLRQIMRSWEQVAKILMALAPILADRGKVAFEGIGWYLDGAFGAEFNQRIQNVFRCAPYNVVLMFKDDLCSPKMGPLLFSHFEEETSELQQHELALLLALERPREWKKWLEKYIGSVAKDSFYLLDVLWTLSNEYRYSFASPPTLREMEYLIKMCYAKHELGANKPGPHQIVKIPQRALPKRIGGDE